MAAPMMPAAYPGTKYRAILRRDGEMRDKETIYNSPKEAAVVATENKTLIGWNFWHYREDGKWIALSKIPQ
jgi:RAMA domain-containing protein